MTTKHDYNPDDNPPVNEREERRGHIPRKAPNSIQDKRSSVETTLTLSVLNDLLRDLYEGIEVPHESVWLALIRVRKALGLEIPGPVVISVSPADLSDLDQIARESA